MGIFPIASDSMHPFPSFPWITFVFLDVPRAPHYQKHNEMVNWHRQPLQAYMLDMTWTIGVIAYIILHRGRYLCLSRSSSMSVFPLANFSQTIDSHDFATSTLKGVPPYPKTGAILPPPSHPTNGPDFTPGIGHTSTSTIVSLLPSITPSSNDYLSVRDNMDVEQTSSEAPLCTLFINNALFCSHFNNS